MEMDDGRSAGACPDCRPSGGNPCGAASSGGLRAPGVPYLTLYAFSVENWKRPHTEIKLLMSLLREYLKKEIGELNRQNIRLEVIGRIQELPEPVGRGLQNALERTRQNTGMQLVLALNYGARAELVYNAALKFPSVSSSVARTS